jgi:hypothetical protein
LNEVPGDMSEGADHKDRDQDVFNFPHGGYSSAGGLGWVGSQSAESEPGAAKTGTKTPRETLNIGTRRAPRKRCPM